MMTSWILGSMLSPGFQGLVGYDVERYWPEMELRSSQAIYSPQVSPWEGQAENQKFGLKQDGNSRAQDRGNGF